MSARERESMGWRATCARHFSEMKSRRKLLGRRRRRDYETSRFGLLGEARRSLRVGYSSIVIVVLPRPMSCRPAARGEHERRRPNAREQTQRVRCLREDCGLAAMAARFSMRTALIRRATALGTVRRLCTTPPNKPPQPERVSLAQAVRGNFNQKPGDPNYEALIVPIAQANLQSARQFRP